MNAVETAGNIEVAQEVIKRHFRPFAETYDSFHLVDHAVQAAERYVSLMCVSTPRLAKNEWLFILEAFWSTQTIFNERRIKDLRSVLLMGVEDTFVDASIVKKWSIDTTTFLKKVTVLTQVEAMAVFHVIEYVKGHAEITTEEALRAAGVSF